MSTVAELEQLIKVFNNLEIAKYMLVASTALLVYDWFLTITEEMQLVWPSKWGLPKALFFLNRYLAIIDPSLLIYVMLYGSGVGGCVNVFRILGAFSSFGFVVAQLVLMMRTWAIWERRMSLTIFFGFLIIACIAADVVALYKYLGGISYVASPAVAIKGCLLQFSNRDVFASFILVMICETIMLVLLVYKALQHFRHSRSTLMVRMYHDGIFYFIFIVVTSIANVCTILLAPVELHNFLIVTQRVLHSILCTRVLLHIRGAYTNSGLMQTNDLEGSRVGHSFAFRRAYRPTSGVITGRSIGVISSTFREGDEWANGNNDHVEEGYVVWGQGQGYGAEKRESIRFDTTSKASDLSPTHDGLRIDHSQQHDHWGKETDAYEMVYTSRGILHQ